MIAITLTQALVLYAVVLGALIAVIWVYTELSTRRTQRFLEKQYLWQCVFCGYTYLDDSGQTLSECPRCHSFNSTADKHSKAIVTREDKRRILAHEEAHEKPRRNPSQRKHPRAKRRGPRRRR